jgi:hypothetical protein
MTDAAPPPNDKTPPRLGEPGEHPLSVFLFSWMRSPFFFRGFMAVAAAIGALMIGLEFLLAPRAYASVESLPGFFGVFGFVAFGLAVLSGWPLSRLMRRPETYYDADEGEGGNDR